MHSSVLTLDGTIEMTAILIIIDDKTQPLPPALCLQGEGLLTVYDSADQLAVQRGIISLHNPQVAIWPLNAGIGMETECVPAVGH